MVAGMRWTCDIVAGIAPSVILPPGQAVCTTFGKFVHTVSRKAMVS